MISLCTTFEANVVVNSPFALVVPDMAPNVLFEPLPDSVTAVPFTALPLASLIVTVSVVIEVPSAVTVGELATRLDVVAEGAPATKLTEVVSFRLPTVAAMVSLCASVEARAVVNTPLALVVPEMVPNELFEPLPDSVTAVSVTGLPLASLTVTVSVVVDLPSAVTVGELATMLEVVAEGAPDTKLTEVVSFRVPAVAVMVSFCAEVEANVVVNWPLALVVPDMAPNVLLEPLPDSVTAELLTGLPLASLTVTVSVVTEVPSAVTIGVLATMLEVVPEGAPATKFTEVVSFKLPTVAVIVSLCTSAEASAVV